MTPKKGSSTQRASAKTRANNRNAATVAANRAGSAVRAPVAMNASSRSRRQRSEPHRECERVGTVVGSVSFANVLDIAINPGLADSFPWLSGVAQHYERYRIDALKVRYKNLKGTSTDGNVLLSFDYDTLDAGPSSAIQATQSTEYKDGAPWRIFEMVVPPDGTKKYIRSGPVAGADLKTYDFGRLWVSAEGCADASDHGYIEFEYNVTLFEKQTADQSAPSNNRVAIFNLSATTSALSASATLDISEEVVNFTGGPTNSSGVVTLPMGNWIVTAEASAVGSALDGNSSIEVHVDGSSMSIPSKSNVGGDTGNTGGFASAATAYIASTGATTVAAYYNHGTANHTFLQDQCRLIMHAI